MRFPPPREDILALRDTIVADPKFVTPMTLMVLAIRFYDVGLRDDAVFWFYAAKDRYLTLDEVVDVAAGGLAQVEDTVRSFSTLAGHDRSYLLTNPASEWRSWVTVV